VTLQVTFLKTGKEIRQAVHNRIERLRRRNEALDVFLSDKTKVRSYVIRSSPLPWGGHGRPDSKALYAPGEISSEEKEEISQLCRRIFEIEQELHRLSLVAAHLKDEQTFQLPYEDLVAYEFEARLDTE
jgi:hypothetical protein